MALVDFQRDASRKSGMPSLIGPELNIKGNMVAASDIDIDGQLEGDIQCTKLVVGAQGTVRGDITAEEVIVRGRVFGGISAKKISMAAGCQVEGAVSYDVIAIDVGARFDGSCRSTKAAVESAMPIMLKNAG